MPQNSFSLVCGRGGVRADGISPWRPPPVRVSLVTDKPAGIAVLVTPWNYPAAMGTRRSRRHLPAGMSVHIKPAPEGRR